MGWALVTWKRLFSYHRSATNQTVDIFHVKKTLIGRQHSSSAVVFSKICGLKRYAHLITLLGASFSRSWMTSKMARRMWKYSVWYGLEQWACLSKSPIVLPFVCCALSSYGAECQNCAIILEFEIICIISSYGVNNFICWFRAYFNMLTGGANAPAVSRVAPTVSN